MELARPLILTGILLLSASTTAVSRQKPLNPDTDASRHKTAISPPAQSAELELYFQLKDSGEDVPLWLQERIENHRTTDHNRHGGDTAAEAVEIPVTLDGSEWSDTGDSSDNSDASGAIAYTTQFGCSGTTIYAGRKDVWYTFTLPVQAEVTLHTCGSSFDTKLAVLDSSMTMIAGDDDASAEECSGGVRVPESWLRCVIPSGSYYVLIDGYNLDSWGAYSLSASFRSAENFCDEYSQNTAFLDAVPGEITVDNTGLPNIYGGTGGDVGVEFAIETSGVYSINACDELTTYAADLFLFDGVPCEGANLLAANTFSEGCSYHYGTAALFNLDLQPGLYHLLVSNTNTADGQAVIHFNREPDRVTQGGPDLFGYTWISSLNAEGPVFQWVEIDSLGTEIEGFEDDNAVGPLLLPFAFPFYGQNYSELYIGSNGVLSFGSGITSGSNQELPNPDAPNNLIAAFWDDLDPDGDTGAVFTWHDVDEQRFIIEYDGVPDYPDESGGQNTFQIALYENGHILLQYLQMEGNQDLCSIGMEDSLGSTGLGVRFTAAGAALTDSLALLFEIQQGDTEPPVITHTAHPDVETESGEDYTIAATITDTGSGVTEASLSYSTGGEDTAVAMESSGDTWTAIIPHQEAGTIVNYSISAVDGNQNAVNSEAYSFFVMSCDWVPQNLSASQGLMQEVVIHWDAPWAEERFGADYTRNCEALMRTHNWSKQQALAVRQQMDSYRPRFANRAFLMYHILRDEEEIGTSAEPTFTDDTNTGLIYGEMYGYRVTAEYESCSSAPSAEVTGYANAAGGPDEFGYTWRHSLSALGPSYNWIDISELGTPLNLNDDDWSGPHSLGFDFDFYGVTQNEVYVGSNGFLSFGGGFDTFSNSTIPSEAVPDNLIAVFWDDLNPSSNEYPGEVYTYIDTALERFIVQWKDVVAYNGSVPLSFEVILEASGNILLQYQQIDENDIESATTGIENESAEIGLLYNFDGTGGGAYQDQLALMFYAPASCDPVQCTGGHNEIEPNDGWDGTHWVCNAIHSGDTICGTVYSDADSADTDCYEYHHFGGRIVIQAEISDFDGLLTLQDDSGTVVQQMNDLPRCGNETLGPQLLEYGSYYLSLTHSIDADPVVGEQTYSLSLLALDDPCDNHESIVCTGAEEVEPNEGWNSDPPSYNEIADGDTLCGTISCENGEADLDCFHFSLLDSSQVQAELQMDEFDAVLYLSDFDPDGEILLAVNETPRCHAETLQIEGLAAGEYYLIVSCSDDADFEEENYRLCLSIDDPLAAPPCEDLVQTGTLELQQPCIVERPAPVLAHNDAIHGCPDGVHSPGLDEVHSFMLEGDGNSVRITMQAAGEADEVLYLLGDCADIEHSCGAVADDYGAGPEAEVLMLDHLPGQLYYVVADFATAGESADYTLSIEWLTDLQARSSSSFELLGNHPNPFNPATTIHWTQANAAEVRLKIWNLKGALVEDFQLGNVQAGQHQFRWNAELLSSGLYFYQLQCGSKQADGKLMLLK